MLRSRMDTWTRSLIPNAETIVRQVARRTQVACLCNMNEVQ